MLPCPHCSVEIKIVLDIFPEIAHISIRELKNGILLKHESTNAEIINLSPNYPINIDMQHQDFVSPDMMTIMQILKNSGTIEKLNKYFPNGGAIDMTLREKC